MTRSISPLLEPFPHIRVLWKALVTGILGLLGGVWILSAFWAPAEDFRKWMFAHSLALPFLLVGFYAVVLLHECVIRSQRLEIEERRSSPMEPRRAKIKAARKQRLRNQHKG